MKIHNIRQRSAEWNALRRGIPTASRFNEIITPQGKRSGQARKYMHELAYEQVLEKNYERKSLAGVAHVQYGIVNEDRAVAAFEAQTRLRTVPVGFITDDAISMGCSPDRLVGQYEALEVKCPQGPTQCSYLIDGLGDAYMAQIQGQMLIGKFTMIHFFSWSAELPPFYARVAPDAAFQKALQQYLSEFTAELITGVAHIRSLGRWPRNAPSVFPEEEDAPT